MRKFFLVALSLAGVLLLHWYLIVGHLYRMYWWADIVLHALGGMWVGGLFLILFGRSQFFRVVLFIFSVGILWEVLEFIFDVPFLGVGEARLTDPIWQLDTIVDLFIDVFAGTLLWATLRRYTSR